MCGLESIVTTGSALKRDLQEVFHVKQRYNVVALNRDVGDFPAMTENRRAAIKRFMASRELKTAPWTRAAGVRESTLRDFLSERNSTMTLETLEKLARAADATIAELIGEKPREMRVGRDVVAVKSLEVRASMGGGFEVLDEPEGPPFYFRRDWVEKVLEGKPGHLRVLTDLDGDSMSPTINDGDMGVILLPGAETKFESGAIYALWDGQGLLVKRLESTVGKRPKLRVISDNVGVYAPYEVAADDVRIIGKLIWRGGGV